MKWIMLVALAALLALGGCGEKNAPPAPVVQEGPTQAQSRLPTIRLWIGPAEVAAEMALTPEQGQTGLMFRTNLDEDGGMIFVFSQPIQAAFWMKNCTVPLSAAYIDPQGDILEIHDLEPHNTNSVVASSPNIQYVLEVNQGWFKRHRIQTGTYVRTEKGTLQETFFTRNPGP
jgi:uncharacterized protein